MAQGFKFKSSAAGSSNSNSKKSGSAPKKGAKYIAPKRGDAVNAAARKKQRSSSANNTLENEMASRALAGGKLTIMKDAAKAGDKALAERRKKKK